MTGKSLRNILVKKGYFILRQSPTQQTAMTSIKVVLQKILENDVQEFMKVIFKDFPMYQNLYLIRPKNVATTDTWSYDEISANALLLDSPST